MNTANLIEAKARAVSTTGESGCLNATYWYALARAISEATFDHDLMDRVATVRKLVRGRIVFTTSFGIEDQAIAHAIFRQTLGIEVVTIDTGRLFPETYELWTQTEPLRSANSGGLPRPRKR